MEFITGKHIPRRTFLSGMSATIGLPLLDAMLPTKVLRRGRGPVATDPTRLVAI